MRRSLTSPFGVLMTTADRFPTSDRASGTTCLVSAASSPKSVARPNGFERVSTMRPTSATSMAASIPIGTLSMSETSSTIGIFDRSRLWTRLPSSAWRMAPAMVRRSAASLMRRATSS